MWPIKNLGEHEWGACVSSASATQQPVVNVKIDKQACWVQKTDGHHSHSQWTTKLRMQGMLSCKSAEDTVIVTSSGPVVLHTPHTATAKVQRTHRLCFSCHTVVQVVWCVCVCRTTRCVKVYLLDDMTILHWMTKRKNTENVLVSGY